MGNPLFLSWDKFYAFMDIAGMAGNIHISLFYCTRIL